MTVKVPHMIDWREEITAADAQQSWSQFRTVNVPHVMDRRGEITAADALQSWMRSTITLRMTVIQGCFCVPLICSICHGEQRLLPQQQQWQLHHWKLQHRDMVIKSCPWTRLLTLLLAGNWTSILTREDLCLRLLQMAGASCLRSSPGIQVLNLLLLVSASLADAKFARVERVADLEVAMPAALAADAGSPVKSYTVPAAGGPTPVLMRRIVIRVL
mmetsp:Transcript_149631/g.259205  ORF Transcript_149631/g.259205 Transcript_149631/m.259205 type:complete len:216 (-) Transcript_149631:19-666(-)